tara:strand:- start:2033 stop:2431 length:399 start_codon:yes stop_codon:yes gene_type:complete
MAAITANGTTLSVGGSVSDVLRISGPSVSAATIDTTSLGSVHRSFVGGIIDSGEMTFDISYDPNDNTVIENLFDNSASTIPAATNCEITFSDSSTWNFNAVLTGFDVGVEMDDKVTASISMKATGAITIAAS